MPTKTRHQCSEMVHDRGGYGSFHQHPCTINATTFEEKQWWCKTHAPSIVANRLNEQTKRFDEKIIAERALHKYKHQCCDVLKGFDVDKVKALLKSIRNNEPMIVIQQLIEAIRTK